MSLILWVEIRMIVMNMFEYSYTVFGIYFINWLDYIVITFNFWVIYS